ncbi:GhoT/OrtT family toxin [Enterobacter mori]|uniref:GhoT/OrtT family toxin n=1 Tax=Enterobacter mori TaxID=539813 RepID=UPI00389156B1
MDIVSTLTGVYTFGFVITSVVIFSISRDTIKYRLIASSLIGLTWPISLPPALMFALL